MSSNDGTEIVLPNLPPDCIRVNIEYLQECRKSWGIKDCEVAGHFCEVRKIFFKLNYSAPHDLLECLALSDWFSKSLKFDSDINLG